MCGTPNNLGIVSFFTFFGQNLQSLAREKKPAGLHEKRFLSWFPCNYRSRGLVQAVPDESLISRSRPNSSRIDPDFRFPSEEFPWKCQMSYFPWFSVPVP